MRHKVEGQRHLVTDLTFLPQITPRYEQGLRFMTSMWQKSMITLSSLHVSIQGTQHVIAHHYCYLFVFTVLMHLHQVGQTSRSLSSSLASFFFLFFPKLVHTMRSLPSVAVLAFALLQRTNAFFMQYTPVKDNLHVIMGLTLDKARRLCSSGGLAALRLSKVLSRHLPLDACRKHLRQSTFNYPLITLNPQRARNISAIGTGSTQTRTNQVNNIMETGGPHMRKIREQFLGLGANFTNANLSFALGLIFSQWQQYSTDASQLELQEFCDYTETNPTTNETAPAQGWAASKGVQQVVDRQASYVYFPDMVNYIMRTGCTGTLNTTSAECPPPRGSDIREGIAKHGHA